MQSKMEDSIRTTTGGTARWWIVRNRVMLLKGNLFMRLLKNLLMIRVLGLGTS